MNFKIRVVENIGEWSMDSFGVPGTELNIVDGEFYDLTHFHWNNYEITFNNFHEINKYFGEEDEWQTVFELVEEEQDDKE